MKKQFAIIGFMLCLLLVACSTKATQYTICYHVFLESETTITKTYAKNEQITEISIPSTKEGYVLEGWYLDPDLKVKITLPYTVTTNEDLYAKWLKLHKITFIVNEKEYATEEVMDEHILNKKEAPNIEGGKFINWYIDKDCLIPYDFESKVYSDFTLYAKYEMTSYDVKFFDQDTLLEKQTVSHGAKVTMPSNPTKKDYTFKGWSIYKDRYEAFDFSTSIKEATTLYAYFEKNLQKKVIITIECENNKISLELDYNTALSLNLLPEKEGYHLVLYKDSNKTIPIDMNNPFKEDTTLYGDYEIKKYIVSFMVDHKIFQTETIDYNTLIEAISAPIKRGYTFKGWSSTIDNYKAFDFKQPIKANTSIYAIYEKNQYTVTYYDGTALLSTTTCFYQDTIENKTAPIKEGFTFKGWSTKRDTYQAFNFSTKIEENIELYVFYEAIQPKITFIIDGTPTIKTINYNTTIPPLPLPEKTGYTVKGWSTKNGSYTPFDFTTPIQKDLTLYAYYEAKEYQIVFINEDSTYHTTSGTYDSTIVFPENPTKLGYVFRGWSSSNQDYIPFTSANKIKENTTLYAFYLEELHVTFVVDTKETKLSVGVGECIKAPLQPQKDGFQFVGWYKDDQLFDFSTPITESIILVARFKELEIELTAFGGYNEGFYFEASPIENALITDYKVTYRKKTGTSWTTVDKELIRLENNRIRCDAVGLEAGEYEVKIDVLEKSMSFTCTVSAFDRSGYAHFKSSTVGAYTETGVAKSNAVIVYVTDQNKNTVKAKLGTKTYTGLSEILQKQNGSTPLIIRIIGTINAATWNKIEYKTSGVTSITPDKVLGENQKVLSKKNYTESEIIAGGFNSLSHDIAAGITKLNGLTNSIKYDSSKQEFDSYYNMLDISSAKNVTVEGIGTNAKLYQWGFTWKNSSSIEIRNLTFDDYTEDACSFEGSDDSTTLEGFKTGQIWIHHNTFNEGKNNWDVCNEQDKHEGDGATDFKKNAYITVAYNHYFKNHKTGLVGGSDSQHTACLTFHHNFYDQCSSRLPLGRQANMHMYNNYYYKSSGTNMSIRANGYALVENCVLENVNNPFETKSNAVIKAYNTILTGCKGTNNATIVNSRTEKVNNSNLYGTDFDTNSTLFYYDSVKKESKVAIMHDVSKVKEYCTLYSGVLKNSTTPPGDSSGGSNIPTPPVEADSWEILQNVDFNSATPITQISYGQIPTEAGLYYAYTTGGSQEPNHLEVSNNKLNIIDNSDTATTFGYYILDASKQNKKLKISLDFIPQTANGKWTPIHFLDSKQNLGIRTNDNKNFGYTLDGGITHIPFSSSLLLTANQTYSIELTIDYVAQATTLKINDASIEIPNYAPLITGIMFQTAGSAIRSFSIDNIIVSVIQ